jgi:outer membrane murein-binding lipoprotein Lpp
MRDVFQNDTINGQPARQKIDSLVNQARSINAEQMQLNGERVRYAAQTAAEIITSLQANRYRTLDSERNEIKKAADNIVPNKPVKDQQNEIKEFFEKTANFLERAKNESLEV